MAETYLDGKGYRRFSNSKKLVSRWVASKKLGRTLKSQEIVHHKNRIKSDNRSSNLWIFKNQKQHNKTHKIDGW